MKILIATVALLLTGTSTMAETWPALGQYVKICDLIILCTTEITDDQPIFKVEEVWKGNYKETDFNKYLQARIPKPNYLPAGLGLHSSRNSHNGQKVVFFFTSTEQKYSGSSTSFDVRDGKLIYAESGNPGMVEEYTLENFKKAIFGFVESQKTNGEQSRD
ncbi:MAG: hypothetical protein PHI93_11475 [Kiritimatiellae bacterium]|jgi:hypothetical protein|nr:hypothetical protein [Kiritimatiellia bacterium]MDY0150096.1 hypothetical protein [Kiritimatiellia bacterium]